MQSAGNAHSSSWWCPLLWPDFLGDTKVADINWLSLVRESGSKRFYKVLPEVTVILMDAVVKIGCVTLTQRG